MGSKDASIAKKEVEIWLSLWGFQRPEGDEMEDIRRVGTVKLVSVAVRDGNIRLLVDYSKVIEYLEER